MDAFQNTVAIDRPADEVFAFLADLQNIPAWNYAIARTVQTSPGPAEAGATYRQARTMPRSSGEVFEVTVFTPPTRRTVQGQIGPFQATTSYLLEPGMQGLPPRRAEQGDLRRAIRCPKRLAGSR
jgi:Polyketide cyclase / dehydrase and lipid transport